MLPRALTRSKLLGRLACSAQAQLACESGAGAAATLFRQAAGGGADAVLGPRAWAALSGRRDFSTDFPMLGVDPVEAADNSGEKDEGADISEQRFHRAAELAMGELFQRLDSFMEDHAPAGASVDMADGMVRLQLSPGHGLTLMKDPEARQLHISSSSAGDKSFALASDPGACTWEAVDGDGGSLHALIQDELQAATGQDVDLEPEPHLYGASTND